MTDPAHIIGWRAGLFEYNGPEYGMIRARGVCAELEAAGYRIVPINPTEEMKKAACDQHAGAVDSLNESTVDGVLYAALAAAPIWGDKDD